MINFQVHIHGLSGYLAGVSIAVKQVMPDHVLARWSWSEGKQLSLIFVHIFRTPLGKITNRHIPLSVFGLTFILWALGAVEGSYCTMFGTGLIVSWVYLRFYQVVLKTEGLKSEQKIQVHSNGSKGDLADSFAFSTLFPNVLQPPVAVLSNTVFLLLVRWFITFQNITLHY